MSASIGPNYDQIVNALTIGHLRGKYCPPNFKIDLSQKFKQFVKEQAFEDDGMADEFDDGNDDDSFFMEWLQDKYDIDPLNTKCIWNDLNKVFKGKYNEISSYKKYKFKKFNIDINNADLKIIYQEIRNQCSMLQAYMSDPLYSIIQIGKQNGNIPLIIYLMDSYNRYRIQKRKKLALRRWSETGWNVPCPYKFIHEECRVYDFVFLKNSIRFEELCQSSMQQLLRRFMHHPPIHFSQQHMINDSIIHICHYIFESYSFIQQYITEKSDILPIQIDISIIPKKMNIKDLSYFDLFDYEEYKIYDNDESDESDDEHVEILDDWRNIGNIQLRLKNQKWIKNHVKYNSAQQIMYEAVNEIINDIHNKKNQRVIIIIDRRENKNKISNITLMDVNSNIIEKNTDIYLKQIDIRGSLFVFGYIRKYALNEYNLNVPVSIINFCILYSLFRNNSDMMYIYQPDVTKKCHSFEPNPSKLIHLSLIQNSRQCLLPKVADGRDIGICENNQLLTLSFHCFSPNECRVYLSFQGWFTRFFIEDIKYYLPEFFEENQQILLRQTLESNDNTYFANQYTDCKHKCIDPKFETFYSLLLWDKQCAH